MNTSRLLQVCALAAAPFTASHAQVLRDPGNVGSAPPADVSTAVDAGRRAQQTFETFRRNSNDRRARAIHIEGLAQYVWIACKAPRPIVVTKNGNRCMVALILFSESAAQRQLYSQTREKGAAHHVAFGFGIQSKVILAVVLVFFGVFFNAFQGAREVDRNLIANARLLGASRWRVTRDVVLPSAFTWILASLHISFGFALIGALVGEILGANQGLGLLIRSSQNNFDMNGVLAGMVLVAVIALTAEALITLLERRLLRWRPPQSHGGAAIE